MSDDETRHSSLFLVTLTLNSTVASKLNSGALANKTADFKSVIDRVFKPDVVKRLMLKNVDASMQSNAEDGDFREKVGEIRVSYGVEIGKLAKGGRLHCHIKIHIPDSGVRVHLRKGFIQRVVGTAMGEKVFIGVRATTPTSDAINRYISKDGEMTEL